MARKYVCVCDENLCSSQPNGFRLLPRTTFDRHRHATLEAATAKNSPEAVSNRRILNIEAEFTTHKRNDLDKGNLSFQPRFLDVPEMQPTSISEMLMESDANNAPFFSYEEWSKWAVESLHQVAQSSSFSSQRAQALINDVSALYSRRFAQVLSLLEAARGSESPKLGHHSQKENSLLLVEAEISAAIKRYHYPSPLAFTCPGNSDANLHLAPQDVKNTSTLEQLRWVSAISADLLPIRTQFKGASGRRLDELLKGLEEHHLNVLAHIEAQKMMLCQPSSSVHTILRSKQHLSRCSALTIK